MHIIRKLTPIAAAIAGVLAVAPAAFAQDANATAAPESSQATTPDPSATTTSSDIGNWSSRFTVVGGGAMQKTTGSGTVDGQRAHFDSDATPTLSASYNVTDNIAIEAWGAGKSGHRVNVGGGKVASVDAQPVALSGQYHFRAPDSTVRPFVGLGYFESNIDNEKTQSDGAFGGQRLGMSTAKGPMATVGVDLNITPTWFARADARYLHGGSDIALDGVQAGHADLDPVMVGVGLGAHF